MQATAVYEGYLKAKQSYFKWRLSATLAQKMALSLGMAALTGLLAQVRLPLPWTPVPVTGQTFAVLLAGVLLGGLWGGVSQSIYVALGAAGIPWFNGGGGGIAFLAGPTGGYLLGFIIAAMMIGRLFENRPAARRFLPLAATMALSALIIYGLGLLQLAVWLRLVQGAEPSFWRLLGMGLLPFLPGEAVKILGAAGAAKALAPHTEG